MVDGRRLWLAGLLAALGAAALFAPTLRHGFVGWDDDIHIHDNPLLNPATGESLRRFWREPYRKLYIPVTYTAWAAAAAAVQRLHPDAPDLSEHPRPFHALNVAAHAANVLLVFSVLAALVGGLAPPLLGALLFAWHPVQVEPVAWTTGFKDLLSGFLALAALRAYVAHARRSSWGLYGLGTACFGLALLAKPSAVAAALIAPVLDVGWLGRSPRQAAKSAAPWWVLAAAAALAARAFQPAEGLASSLISRPLIALDSLAFYLYKLVLPIGLAPHYGRTPGWVLESGWAYVSWLAPVLPAVWAWRKRASSPLLGCLAVFAAGILPVSGLVPFQHQVYSTTADRYLYLSMLGPALALAWMTSRRPDRATWGISAALLAVLAALSFLQARRWRDTRALFAHTLTVNPSSAVAHNNLGHDYFRAGELKAAAEHYESALKLRPDYGIALNNLGNIHLTSDRPLLALPYYERALALSGKADRVDALNNMGLALDRLGRTTEAIERLREAVALEPGYEKAYNNLGLILARLGDLGGALEAYRRAVELKPNFLQARRNLSTLLNDLGFQAAHEGRLGPAGELYREALAVQPANLKALANLGDTLLAQGRTEEALRLWREGLRVLPESPELRHNMAVALLRLGRREEAHEALREALRLQPGFPPSQALLEALEK